VGIKGKGLRLCRSGRCFNCTGALASNIPADGGFFLTAFGGPSDASTRGRRTACGQSVDRLWWYATSSKRWPCGTKLRVTNPQNGKCAVVQVADAGPALCVEQAAGGPVLDATPLLARHLFGVDGAGWSERRRIHVQTVASSTPAGPCAGGAPAPQPQPEPEPEPVPEPQPDPTAQRCEQVGYAGECIGEVLEWCEGGRLRQVDCQSRGATCGWQSDSVGNNCLAQTSSDPCGGVDFTGYCAANGTLVWCDDGVLRQYSCPAAGLTCAYVNGTIGYDCVR
jgi:hypothetical protein